MYFHFERESASSKVAAHPDQIMPDNVGVFFY